MSCHKHTDASRSPVDRSLTRLASFTRSWPVIPLTSLRCAKAWNWTTSCAPMALTVNSASNLQIGQRLLIPHPGCRVDERTGEPLPVTLEPTLDAAADPPPVHQPKRNSNFRTCKAWAILLPNPFACKISAAISISVIGRCQTLTAIPTDSAMSCYFHRPASCCIRAAEPAPRMPASGAERKVFGPPEKLLTLADPQGRVVQTLQLPGPDEN